MIDVRNIIEHSRNSSPAHVRDLVAKIGLPRVDLARLLGLHLRTLERYLQDPTAASVTIAPRSVVIVLELLAATAENH